MERIQKLLISGMSKSEEERNLIIEKLGLRGVGPRSAYDQILFENGLQNIIGKKQKKVCVTIDKFYEIDSD